MVRRQHHASFEWLELRLVALSMGRQQDLIIQRAFQAVSRHVQQHQIFLASGNAVVSEHFAVAKIMRNLKPVRRLAQGFHSEDKLPFYKN